MFHNLFYSDGKIFIPLNIEELLTPLSLICDDGCFWRSSKTNRVVYLSTECFTLAEINLLVSVLTQKFGLKCTINQNNSGFRIIISAESMSDYKTYYRRTCPA